ncbi:elongation factor 1-delta [Callorhinchus milii]|nr:elongation factor 1-delta [Callorhinchus milii]
MPGPGLPAPALGESKGSAQPTDTTWPLQWLLHQDSEPVWLSKAACDQAERRYQQAKAQSVAAGFQELTPKQPGGTTEVAERPGLLNKTMAGEGLAQEKVWFDKYKYDNAERQFYENLNRSVSVSKCPAGAQENGASNILRDIARARENIQKSLAGISSIWEPDGNSKGRNRDNPISNHSAVQGADNGELCNRVSILEKENEDLHKVVEDLRSALGKLESRLCAVERSAAGTQAPLARPAAPAQHRPSAEAPAEEEDDDIDLFGSDEDEEASRIREERIRQYSQRKSKKPALIAKSSILLDVKPWSDETDMAKLEACVRSVQVDGLLWGCSKLLPVGYGIRKLQIQCVVEDDKVGTDLLEEEITKFEEFVQSVDVAAFNKI